MYRGVWRRWVLDHANCLEDWNGDKGERAFSMVYANLYAIWIVKIHFI